MSENVLDWFPEKILVDVKISKFKSLTQLASLQSGVVIRLGFPLFSTPAPEGETTGDVGGRDPLVPVSPEPAVDVDGLEVLGVTAFVLEITLPTGGVD